MTATISTRPRLRSHGTTTGYHAGCRCGSCRAAHASYARERRRRLGERKIADMQAAEREDLLRRLMQRVRIDESTGCWLWTRRPTPGGYGQISVAGRMPMAHRVAYELLVGPIPEGLELDHVCHNQDPDCFADKQCIHRRCVNPDHLEPVTPRVNTLRGKTPAARAKARTVCVNGHPLTSENVYLTPRGHRKCIACQRIAAAKWEAKNRGRRNAQARARYAKRPRRASTPEERRYRAEWARRRRAQLKAQVA